jgi:hypothetical protein
MQFRKISIQIDFEHFSSIGARSPAERGSAEKTSLASIIVASGDEPSEKLKACRIVVSPPESILKMIACPLIPPPEVHREPDRCLALSGDSSKGRGRDGQTYTGLVRHAIRG